MKKVLMISCDYPPEIGGASIVAKDIVTNLVKKDYKLTLITHFISDRPQNDNISIIEIKFQKNIWISFCTIMRSG